MKLELDWKVLSHIEACLIDATLDIKTAQDTNQAAKAFVRRRAAEREKITKFHCQCDEKLPL